MKQIELLKKLLQDEIVQVVGCTEPAGVAYALSHARHLLGASFDPVTVTAELHLSKEVKRNASTAVVPFLNRRGLRTVASAGLAASADDFNLFPSVDVKAAEKLLARRRWLHVAELGGRAFRIRVVVRCGRESAEVEIRARHDRIFSAKRNGKSIKQAAEPTSVSLTLEEIYSAVRRRDSELEAVARDFVLSQVRGDEELPMDRRIAELIRARMCGSPLPVITLTGSGNQGIFIGVPFCVLYAEHGNSVLPSVLLALLIQIYRSEKKNRISGECGLAQKAAPALAAGIALHRGATLNQIKKLMLSVESELDGMKCHGALPGCGKKAEKAYRTVMKHVEALVPSTRFIGR